jgi:polygalacturonase
VPGGKAFDLSGLTTGTTVSMAGDVVFTAAQWDGPMFIIDGEAITFQGNGHQFDGQGAKLWDTLGSNGGVTKVRRPKSAIEFRYCTYTLSSPHSRNS